MNSVGGCANQIRPMFCGVLEGDDTKACAFTIRQLARHTIATGARSRSQVIKSRLEASAELVDTQPGR